MLEIKQLPKSEIEIIGEMAAEDFSKFWPKAVVKFSKSVSLPGFRPGKVPEKILVDRIGEAAILEEAGELALQDVYFKILEEKKIEAVGSPRATIMKIAKNSPLGFKFQVAVLPSFELPENYREIAKNVFDKKEEIKVEEKEVDDSVEYLKKVREKQPDNKNLPEINEELKNTIRKNIQFEKETKMKEKKRLEALDEILKKIKMEIPDILVESEKKRMLLRMKGDLSGMGIKWEDYLNHLKKADLDILAGFSDDALKSVKYGLVLDKLAVDLKIEVKDEEITEQIKKLNFGGNIDRQKLKDYAYGIIRNEKIFISLEK